MERNDERTEEQKKTFTRFIIGTDKFMSGWGRAEGGKSIAIWACLPEDEREVLDWVERRSDMSRVRVSDAASYKPGSGVAHVHIYVADEKHPALARKYEHKKEQEGGN